MVTTGTGLTICNDTSELIVRQFLVFHARDHTGTLIPDRLSFPKPLPVKPPRLISEAEIGRVLAVAPRLPPTPTNPLRAETIRLGLILLFCCGLRCGEPLRLRLRNIDEEQTALRNTLNKYLGIDLDAKREAL